MFSCPVGHDHTQWWSEFKEQAREAYDALMEHFTKEELDALTCGLYKEMGLPSFKEIEEEASRYGLGGTAYAAIQDPSMSVPGLLRLLIDGKATHIHQRSAAKLLIGVFGREEPNGRLNDSQGIVNIAWQCLLLNRAIREHGPKLHARAN